MLIIHFLIFVITSPFVFYIFKIDDNVKYIFLAYPIFALSVFIFFAWFKYKYNFMSQMVINISLYKAKKNITNLLKSLKIQYKIKRDIKGLASYYKYIIETHSFEIKFLYYGKMKQIHFNSYRGKCTQEEYEILRQYIKPLM